MSSNQQIRRAMRARRRDLSQRQRDEAAETLRRVISGCHFLLSARRVAVYSAFDGEIDPQPLVDQLWAARREVYLPVIQPQSTLAFARYLPDTVFRLNRYGIAEPDATAAERLSPRHLDLVLAPVVAFAADGRRLGMGGGYYDRTFSYLRRRTGFRRPFLAGIAYDFQLDENIETRQWDVTLRKVVTDKAIYPPRMGQ